MLSLTSNSPFALQKLLFCSQSIDCTPIKANKKINTPLPSPTVTKQILQKRWNKIVDFFVTCAKHHLGSSVGFDCLCLESFEWASLRLHCWVLQGGHIALCSGLLNLGPPQKGMGGVDGMSLALLHSDRLLHRPGSRSGPHYGTSLFLSFVCPLGLRTQVPRMNLKWDCMGLHSARMCCQMLACRCHFP